MSSTGTFSESTTFTLAHARILASKVAADLKRMQRLYAYPPEEAINRYEAEITTFLKAGYLGTVWYGFKKDGKWIEPTLRYTARELNGLAANDDDPGRVMPGKNVEGASFYTFLTYGAGWDSATAAEKEQFRKSLPYTRGTGSEPEASGYFADDRNYSAGGRALGRATLKG